MIVKLQQAFISCFKNSENNPVGYHGANLVKLHLRFVLFPYTFMFKIIIWL